MSTPTLQTPPVEPAEAPPAPRRRRIPLWFWPAGFLAAVFVLAVLRVVTGADDIASSGVIGAAIALAVPIGLAGLGGLWSERAGVVNIGLEGMMILGTWGAGFFGYYMGPWAGIVGGMLCGIVGGLIHATATVIFGVDHIVSGVALNITALGIAKYLAARFFSDLPGGGPTQSPPLPSLPRFSVPGLSEQMARLEAREIFFLSDLAGVIGGFTTNISAFTIIAVLLFIGTFFVLWRTAFGLRLRSCGESPVAAETLGVNVIRYKFIAVCTSGALAGMGGAFLALVAANIYRDGQTGGRGYIGLAAMIFGNWRPGGLAAGSLLFGYTDAARLRGGGTVHALLLLVAVILLVVGAWQLKRNNRVQGITSLVVATGAALWYFSTDSVPGELAAATPYVTTLLVLAFASQRLRMPAADGQIYRKGEGH
ncbi:ABC transporter permease [Nostocoides sp. F2B08]|uniref:ABC transporter permease n=1 Tax=Nostocoides sp. F2B08 TaxID=2653936 RepID=UPI001262AE9D|nr:ABC transporter permease [Tetrasphaera sp. F2B08]KAB7741990.1 ABC transporter permease [Tetrasphaera sp. F2B08]